MRAASVHTQQPQGNGHEDCFESLHEPLHRRAPLQVCLQGVTGVTGVEHNT